MSGIRSISVILVSFLCGCSTWYEWAQRGATAAQQTQDARECRAISQLRGDSDPAYERCMQDRGYVIVKKMELLF